MFIILSILFVSVCFGTFLSNVKLFKHTETSISYTIFIMLFVFGISIGSNKNILNNIQQLGAQAAIIAIAGVAGSLFASYLAVKIFKYKKGGKNEK